MPELTEEEIRQQEKAKKRRAITANAEGDGEQKKKKNVCKSRKANNKSVGLPNAGLLFCFKENELCQTKSLKK